jgi:hypothetical protein
MITSYDRCDFPSGDKLDVAIDAAMAASTVSGVNDGR